MGAAPRLKSPRVPGSSHARHAQRATTARGDRAPAGHVPPPALHLSRRGERALVWLSTVPGARPLLRRRARAPPAPPGAARARVRLDDGRRRARCAPRRPSPARSPRQRAPALAAVYRGSSGGSAGGGGAHQERHCIASSRALSLPSCSALLNFKRSGTPCGSQSDGLSRCAHTSSTFSGGYLRPPERLDHGTPESDNSCRTPLKCLLGARGVTGALRSTESRPSRRRVLGNRQDPLFHVVIRWMTHCTASEATSPEYRQSARGYASCTQSRRSP